MNDDYYSVLGVSRTVTATELKERYRFLCHAYHPDKFANDTQRQRAENDFKRINEAYEVLSNPDSRARYDSVYFQSSQAANNPQPPPPELSKFARVLSWMWVNLKIEAIVLLCSIYGLFLIADWKQQQKLLPPPPPELPPPPPELPRLSDVDFMNWLVGQIIVTEKNTFFPDRRWKIGKGEISAFKVIKITENPADKIYSATLSFRATVNGSGIEVKECLLRYRKQAESNKLEFVEFVPISFSRIGN